MSPTELAWTKASLSMGANACVELAPDGPLIVVRNSREPHVSLRYTHAEIVAFFHAVKAGEFDHLITRTTD